MPQPPRESPDEQPTPLEGRVPLPYIPATAEDAARLDGLLTHAQQARARFLRGLLPRVRAALMRRWGLRPEDLTEDLAPPPAE